MLIHFLHQTSSSSYLPPAETISSRLQGLFADGRWEGVKGASTNGAAPAAQFVSQVRYNIDN